MQGLTVVVNLQHVYRHYLYSIDYFSIRDRTAKLQTPGVYLKQMYNEVTMTDSSSALTLWISLLESVSGIDKASG